MARALAKPLKQTWPSASDEFDGAACLALVEAAQSFDPARNVQFATFARFRIQGALRDVKRGLFLPVWRGHEKYAPEIISPKPCPDVPGRVVGIPTEPPAEQAMESIDAVEHWLSRLPPKHAFACRQIYLHGKTQCEVAAQLGCSKSRISVLHKEAMELLNEEWETNRRLREELPRARRRRRRRGASARNPDDFARRRGGFSAPED
jgi:RNA polymerase sigma factor (sigma-70 family)